MSKIMFVEFESDLSLDEIMRELLNYKSMGLKVSTKVNGEIVYSFDEDIFDTFERLVLNIPKSREEEFKQIKLELSSIEERKDCATRINIDLKSNYYMNLASRLVPNDKVYDFQNELVRYSEPIIIVVAQLLLALSHDNIIDIYRDIDKVIISTNAMGEARSIACLISAVGIVIKYSQKGEILKNMFYDESLGMYNSILNNKESELQGKMKLLSRNNNKK